jgi:cyclopropane-fatty-acyl-phospholipid synthase
MYMEKRVARAKVVAELAADFESIQAHYDLSNEFFALFLDPTMTYTCAKFDSPTATLEEAQRAKVDHTLKKCELRRGMRLLEVGCGWGATAMRASELYKVKVTALTLSAKQCEYARERARGNPDIEFRLQGWEDFDEKVDAIVSIGAMEHFGVNKYAAFFERCYELLPERGNLVVHLITLNKPNESFRFLRFRYFLSANIFPNAFAPPPELVLGAGREAGFEMLHAESLHGQYQRTLDCWLENLQRNREKAAAITSEENVRIYEKYLADCAFHFRAGDVTLHQFKFRKV